MEITNNWILPALILVPFIAGFACWIVDKLDTHLPRYIALIGMLVTLALVRLTSLSDEMVATEPVRFTFF